MKTQLIAVLASGLLYTPLACAAENKSAATPGRISVFKAPLVCPAAPQIGCGSASKPILLDLERQPGVLEAWLRRGRDYLCQISPPRRSEDHIGEKERRAASRGPCGGAEKMFHGTREP